MVSDDGLIPIPTDTDVASPDPGPLIVVLVLELTDVADTHTDACPPLPPMRVFTDVPDDPIAHEPIIVMNTLPVPALLL